MPEATLEPPMSMDMSMDEQALSYSYSWTPFSYSNTGATNACGHIPPWTPSDTELTPDRAVWIKYLTRGHSGHQQPLPQTEWKQAAAGGP